MNDFKNAIALTGGISTGKSTVCNILKLHGFSIIDADSIAHKILDENSIKIGDMFGEGFLKDSKIDRKMLGGLIFSNPDAKKKLEAFIHPLIKAEILNQANICEAKNKPYIVDIPLFYETKNYPIDKVVVVYCPQKIQIERLCKRDNIDESTALQKISNQMNIDEKKSMATFVIDNSEDFKYLQKQIEKFVKEVL